MLNPKIPLYKNNACAPLGSRKEFGGCVISRKANTESISMTKGLLLVLTFIRIQNDNIV